MGTRQQGDEREREQRHAPVARPAADRHDHLSDQTRWQRQALRDPQRHLRGRQAAVGKTHARATVVEVHRDRFEPARLDVGNGHARIEYDALRAMEVRNELELETPRDEIVGAKHAGG
jgi:hypothetical protein